MKSTPNRLDQTLDLMNKKRSKATAMAMAVAKRAADIVGLATGIAGLALGVMAAHAGQADPLMPPSMPPLPGSVAEGGSRGLAVEAPQRPTLQGIFRRMDDYIDGVQVLISGQMLGIGQTSGGPLGVRVLSIGAMDATVEWRGQRMRLTMFESVGTIQRSVDEAGTAVRGRSTMTPTDVGPEGKKKLRRHKKSVQAKPL